MDVVPAPHTKEWLVPPFSGHIRDGMIIGRGTQDMKGVGVVHYYALKALKEAGIQPQRTIHVIAVPDEERGGFGGTGQLIETDAFKNLNVGYVLDEGCPSSDPSSLHIKIDERKPLQIRLTAEGERAHGSKLAAHNAAHDLIQVLERVVTHHTTQQRRIERSDPGTLLSMNITSLQAGSYNEGSVALNVVSEHATATVDIRVPPALRLEDVHALLHHELQQFPSITLTIEATVDERTVRETYVTPLYRAVAESIITQGLQPKPLVTEGASDLRFHLKQGIDGIGFSPFTTKDTLHGVNEAVSIVDMIRGKEIIIDILQRMCVLKEN